jgi:hypothetical protein
MNSISFFGRHFWPFFRPELLFQPLPVEAD